MCRQFFIGKWGRRAKTGCGVREGVPLMRHNYIGGMYTGEFEKPVSIENPPAPESGEQRAKRAGGDDRSRRI